MGFTRHFAVVAALATAACAPAVPAGPPPAPRAVAAPPAAAPRCLSIAAWNDLHGQLSPDSPTVDTGRVPAGGVVALADQVALLRATGDDVVTLDAGDLFTGPLASTLAEGAPVIDAYRVLGVDAAAIGNHEFDFGPVGYERVTAAPGVGDDAGPDGPRGALFARIQAASFVFVSANIRKKGGGSPGWPGVPPSKVVERGAWRVGVVGYTTIDTRTTTLVPNVADLDFATGAAASVATSIRGLRGGGAFPIVLLAHASLEGELPQALGDGAEHRGEIATLVAALGADLPDIIVAGHRHAWMLGRVRGVPIVSSDQHGVGLARIRYCREGGAPKLESIERRVTMATRPPLTELGARVAAAIAPWEERVRAQAEADVTTIGKPCVPRAPNGSAFLDQVARATAEQIRAAAVPPPGVPVVGLINAGSVRTSMQPGAVRYGDVFEALPFENTVAACGTTRAGLLRFLQNALGKESSRERFPLGIAGARVHVRRAADRALSLAAVEIDGEPKKPRDDAPVWFALSDFVLWGGDDLLAGVTCAPSTTSQMRIRDAWKDLLAREHGCDGGSKSVVME